VEAATAAAAAATDQMAEPGRLDGFSAVISDLGAAASDAVSAASEAVSAAASRAKAAMSRFIPVLAPVGALVPRKAVGLPAVPPLVLAAAQMAGAAVFGVLCLCLRDPVLLYLVCAGALLVFFGGWWPVYCATAVLSVLRLAKSYDAMTWDMVSTIMSAGSALSFTVDVAFACAAAFGMRHSMLCLVMEDPAGFVAESGRFLPLACLSAAKLALDSM
jgi:hypothetical protein